MALQFSSLNTALTRTAGLPATYNPITIAGWVRLESSLTGITYCPPFELWSTSGSTVLLSTNGSGDTTLDAAESKDGTNYVTVSSGNALAIGTWNYVAVVYDGSNVGVYSNPFDAAGIASIAGASGTIQTLNNFAVGASPHAVLEYFRGSIAGLKIWTRALTADQLRREARSYLPADPIGCVGCYPLLNRATGHLDFSGLRQDLTWGSTLAAESDGPSGVRWAPQSKKSRVLIQTAWRAGNTYTLVADPGSIAIAGQSLTLKASRALVAASASVPISGQPVTLKAGRRLVVAVANVPVTGVAAALMTARKLSAATGAVSVTGLAAALKANRRIAADPVNLPVSGQALTLSVQRRLVAATGALPITGIAANLYAARRLTAAVGTVPIAAPSVALPAARRLVAEAATVPVSGVPIALRAGRRLIAATGAVAVTGWPMSLTNGSSTTLVADVGSVPVTGIAANLYTARRLTAAVGTVPIAASAVSLRVARRLVADAATVPVSGLPAALRASRRIAAAPGQIIIVSPDIALRVGRRLRAEAGSVPVFGLPVDLVHGGSAPAVAIHSIEVSAAARGAEARFESRGAAVTVGARSTTIARAT